MEDKMINEQESLNLISNMIKQTNNHMALGAGNTFIAWGVILVVVSITANTAVAMTHNGLWMWLYMAILVIGLPVEWWIKRSAKQKNGGHVKTYIEDSIEKVWKCVGAMLIAYPAILLYRFYFNPDYHIWLAMFFIGMLLPAIGSYITGVMIKSKVIEFVSIFGCVGALFFLVDLINPEHEMTLVNTYIFPFVSVFTLIIPGIQINRKAEENNK